MKCVGEFSGIKIYTIDDNEMVLCKYTAEAFVGYMKQIFPMTKAATEPVEAARTDSQQLKPKMPSFVEFDEWCRDNLCATRRDIYDYMARHFGH
jgi:hypothetical protein